MTKKQPNTDIKSDARDRLYKMITKAKPESHPRSLWQCLRMMRLERKVTKGIRARLAYYWRNYEKLTAPQRQALDDYITTQHMKIALEDLLWEKGYRHGDHVLIYDAIFGSFRQRAIAKFDDEAAHVLFTPEELPGWEDGRHVQPGDRTKRKSQPDLTRHETSWLINSK